MISICTQKQNYECHTWAQLQYQYWGKRLVLKLHFDPWELLEDAPILLQATSHILPWSVTAIKNKVFLQMCQSLQEKNSWYVFWGIYRHTLEIWIFLSGYLRWIYHVLFMRRMKDDCIEGCLLSFIMWGLQNKKPISENWDSHVMEHSKAEI